MFTPSELCWYWHAQGSQAERMKRLVWVPLKGYPRITEYEIIILTYPWLCNSGHLIPTYPWICKSRHLIPTYSGLSQYPNLFWVIPIYKIYTGISLDILTCPGCRFSRCWPLFFIDSGSELSKILKKKWPELRGFQVSSPDCPTLPSVTDKTCCVPAFFGVDHKKKTVLLTYWSLEFTWTWRNQKNGWPKM